MAFVTLEITEGVPIQVPEQHADRVKRFIDESVWFAGRMGFHDARLADFEAGGAPDDMSLGEIRGFQAAVGVKSDDPNWR